MGKKFLTIMLFLSVPMMLTGCLEPEAEKTSGKSAQELVDSMTYVKAKNGLCFGVGTVSKWSTNGTASMNVFAVSVDCGKIGH